MSSDRSLPPGLAACPWIHALLGRCPRGSKLEHVPSPSVARFEARACSIPERRDASMRLNQGARFATLVGTVVLLTAACSLGALLTARKMERLMETMVSNNLPSVVAAVELETALQRQRGLVDAFMLDGGQPGWLNDLDRAKPSLAHWLAEAKRTARTDEERKTLAMLTAVYKSYDEERERAITLYQEGHALEARRVLLRDVSLLSNQADDLCRQLVASNQLYINTSMRQGHRQAGAPGLVLAAGVGLAILLSLSLVLIVFRRFLLPVRRLAQDAKAFSDDRSPAGRASFQDEFHELEFYSRALMSDVARTRTDLEESERRLLVARSEERRVGKERRS